MTSEAVKKVLLKKAGVRHSKTHARNPFIVPVPGVLGFSAAFLQLPAGQVNSLSVQLTIADNKIRLLAVFDSADLIQAA